MVQNVMSEAVENNISVKGNETGNFLQGDKFLNDCLYLHLEERKLIFLMEAVRWS